MRFGFLDTGNGVNANKNMCGGKVDGNEKRKTMFGKKDIGRKIMVAGCGFLVIGNKFQ